MSFNKALKFALEKFADYPEIWIGVGFVFILLVCFLVFKFIRRQSSRQHREPHATSDSNIDDIMRDEKNSLAAVMASLNEEDSKQQQAENMPQDNVVIDATQPVSATEHLAGRDDDSGLIDELRIPRQGEADDMPMADMQTHDIEDMTIKTETTPNRPEKIAKFLGRKKRGGDEKTKMTQTHGTHDIGDSSAKRDELIEIERKLLALRELHDAGLIATEIYLLKSREFAKKSKR